MQLLRGRTAGVETLAVSPDSRFVVAAGEYNGCHAWDLHDAKPSPRVLLAGKQAFFRLAYLSPTSLVACVGHEWWRFDLETATQVLVSRPNIIQLHDAILHPSGELVKACSLSGRRVLTVQFTQGHLEIVGPSTKASCVLALIAFNPNGRQYLVHDRYPADPQRGCHLRDSVTDQIVATFDQPAGWLLFESAPWAFTPDGSRALVAASHYLLAFDCDSGGPPAVTLTHPVPGGLFHALAVHPDGRRVATVEDHRTVTLRDADTLQPLRSYDFAMPKVTCVAFTPDGTRCVIGNSRGKVLLFDVE